MPLSANTVFHFTKEKDSLIGILQDNFYVHYCSETIPIGIQQKTIYVPMVSFCDIPLSEIKTHINSYGPYGIGLSKEWAERSRLNPVIYMEKLSLLSASLFKFVTALVDNTAPEHGKYFFDILRYMKNYQGDLVRKDKPTVPDYRFSDEREWRYVPEFSKTFPMLLIKGFTDNLLDIAKHDISSERLVFTPTDVNYIIVEKESERAEFIGHLRRAKAKKYEEEDIVLLTSKLTSKERIIGDF